MKKYLLVISLLITISLSAQENYKTESGLEFKVGDTLTLGQPLSHLGWRSIYTEEGKDYITNKNLVNKKVTIKTIDTTKKDVAFIVIYKRKPFYVLIDEALKNNEVMLSFRPELSNNFKSKYQALRELKSLLDDGILTEKEFTLEKKKILENK